MPNKRTGVLTFAFTWYAFGTIIQMLYLAHLFGKVGGYLLEDVLWGVQSFVITIPVIAICAASIRYLVKLWRADESLAWWTDLIHAIYSVLLLLLLVASFSFVRYALMPFVSSGVVFLMLLIPLAINVVFWLGLQAHLARLEREGQASFSPRLLG